MRIAQEEIFGPVMAVLSFDDEEGAIRIANDTNYGLAAGVWTSDLDTSQRVSAALNAGTVCINSYQMVYPGVSRLAASSSPDTDAISAKPRSAS